MEASMTFSVPQMQGILDEGNKYELFKGPTLHYGGSYLMITAKSQRFLHLH
jgi:hypothetical protein